MVLVPGSKDLAYFSRINKEVHVLFFPQLKFYSRLVETENIDPLYGESQQRVYGDPIFFPAFVDYTVERRRLLTLFGKDEERDLIIWCSLKVMDELEIRPKSGDVWVVDDKEFKVMDESLRSHVINQNIYLERGYSTKQRRGSSLIDDRVDENLPEPNDEFGELGQEPPTFDSQFVIGED